MGKAIEVATGVHVTTSRLYTTTSTVLVRGQSAVLVDPAWLPDELEGLADRLDADSWDVRFGVATHAHHDHILWHPRYGEVPRYASEQTVALATEHRHELVASLGDDWPPELVPLVGELTPFPTDLDWGEDVEIAEHAGHAPGHVALWFAERRVLVVGDMLSDVELPLPLDPDDLPAYLDALDLLAPTVQRASVLIPGHGTPTDDPVGRLDADRRYLDALISGSDPDDPRRANPGMAEVHERVRALTIGIDTARDRDRAKYGP